MNFFCRHLTFFNRKRGNESSAPLELAKRASRQCEGIFVRRWLLLSQLPIKKEGEALGNFKDLSHEESQADFAKNLCAPPFMEALSIDTTTTTTI